MINQKSKRSLENMKIFYTRNTQSISIKSLQQYFEIKNVFFISSRIRQETVFKINSVDILNCLVYKDIIP